MADNVKKDAPAGESVTHCGKHHRMEVVETRAAKIGWLHTVWRRKQCKVCGIQIRTAEIEYSLAQEVLADD